MATPRMEGGTQSQNSPVIDVKKIKPVQSLAAAELAAQNEQNEKTKNRSSSSSVSRKFAAIRAGCFGSKKTHSRASSRTSQKSSPLLISSNGIAPSQPANEAYATVSGPGRQANIAQKNPATSNDEHASSTGSRSGRPRSAHDPTHPSTAAENQRRTQSSATRLSTPVLPPPTDTVEIVFPSQTRQTSAATSVRRQLTYSRTSLVSVDDHGQPKSKKTYASVLTACTSTNSTPAVETVDSRVTTVTQGFPLVLDEKGSQSISDCRTHYDRSPPIQPMPVVAQMTEAVSTVVVALKTTSELPQQQQQNEIPMQEKAALATPQAMSTVVSQSNAQMQSSAGNIEKADETRVQQSTLPVPSGTPSAAPSPTASSSNLSASKSKLSSVLPSSSFGQKPPGSASVTKPSASTKLKGSSSCDSVVANVAKPKLSNAAKTQQVDDDKQTAVIKQRDTLDVIQASSTNARPRPASPADTGSASGDRQPSVEYITSNIAPPPSPRAMSPSPSTQPPEAIPSSDTTTATTVFPSLFSRVNASQRMSQFMPVVGSLMNRRSWQTSQPATAGSGEPSVAAAPAAQHKSSDPTLETKTSTTQTLAAVTTSKADIPPVTAPSQPRQVPLQRRASEARSRDSFALFAAPSQIVSSTSATAGGDNNGNNNISSNVTLPASHLTGFLARLSGVETDAQTSSINNMLYQQQQQDQLTPSAAFLLNPEGRPPGSILATDITTRLEGMRSAFASPIANMMSQAIMHDANAQQAFALHLYPPPKVRSIKNLSESVVELRHARSGSSVFIVPVQPFDEASANLVEETIKEVDPDIVFVQVGKNDMRALCDTDASDDELLANESRCQWRSSFTTNCNNYGHLAGLVHTIHQSNLAAATRRCGVVQKHAYRAALQQAETLSFCDVIYGIRPDTISMQRLYNTMSLMEKLRLLCRMCFARFNSSSNFATYSHFPRARRIMIDECDKYTVAVLQYYSQAVLRTSAGRSPAVLVAITDQQHVAGIVKYWNRRIDLKSLLE